MSVQSIQSQSENWSEVYTSSEKNIKNFLLMKIWVHLLEREINLMGRPRTGAKDLLGTASQTENKQTCFHIENEEMIVAVNAIYAIA